MLSAAAKLTNPISLLESVYEQEGDNCSSSTFSDAKFELLTKETTKSPFLLFSITTSWLKPLQNENLCW